MRRLSLVVFDAKVTREWGDRQSRSARGRHVPTAPDPRVGCVAGAGGPIISVLWTPAGDRVIRLPLPLPGAHQVQEGLDPDAEPQVHLAGSVALQGPDRQPDSLADDHVFYAPETERPDAGDYAVHGARAETRLNQPAAIVLRARMP
jgi:hypothetical protein